MSDAELTKTISEVDSIADEIRRNVFTFDEATQYISTDKDTRNNHGLMVNPNTGSSKFEMKDLPQEVAKVVVNMNVGEISKPFVMMNNSEKEVVAIVKLKNKVEGHKANISLCRILSTINFAKRKSISGLEICRRPLMSE